MISVNNVLLTKLSGELLACNNAIDMAKVAGNFYAISLTADLHVTWMTFTTSECAREIVPGECSLLE
jgi:hypothetical protein